MDIEELKARVATLEGELIGARAGFATEGARSDRLIAQNKRLHKLLVDMLQSVRPHPMDNGAMYHAWQEAKSFIANTP